MGILSQIIQSVVTVVKEALESISNKAEKTEKKYRSGSGSSSSDSYSRWIDERMEKLKRADETNKSLINALLSGFSSIILDLANNTSKRGTVNEEPSIDSSNKNGQTGNSTKTDKLDIITKDKLDYYEQMRNLSEEAWNNRFYDYYDGNDTRGPLGKEAQAVEEVRNMTLEEWEAFKNDTMSGPSSHGKNGASGEAGLGTKIADAGMIAGATGANVGIGVGTGILKALEKTNDGIRSFYSAMSCGTGSVLANIARFAWIGRTRKRFQ